MSSENYSEQVFDYLLEEMMIGPAPPDLRTKIASAWAAERASPLNPAGGLRSELSLTSQHGVVGGQALPANSKQPASARLSNSRNARLRRRRHSGPSLMQSLGVSLAVIAASLLLAWFGWSQFVASDAQFLPGTDSGRDTLADRRPSQALTEPRSREGNAQWPSSNSAVVKNTDAPGSAAESSAKEEPYSESTLATNVDRQSRRTTDGRASEPSTAMGLDEAERLAEASRQHGSAVDSQLVPGPLDSIPEEEPIAIAENSVEKHTPAEIVAQLNDRFRKLWRQQQVMPSTKLSPRELAEKTHLDLMGQSLSKQGVDAIYLTNGELKTQEWVQHLVKQPSFHQHWADILSQRWLKKSAQSYDGQGAIVLQSFLAGHLATATPWNQVVHELLGGELHSGGPAESTKNASSVFYSALAVEGEHDARLVRRLGTNFLNVNVACSQCHDADQALETLSAEAMPDAAAPWSAFEELAVLAPEDQYWSMAAMLKGISASGTYDSGRSLRDDQATLFASKDPTAFVERPDGNVEFIVPKLPDGREWRSLGEATPRQALARWVTESEWCDRAAVNLTWLLLFGQHLAPQTAGLESEAVGPRREILDYLAQQFRAHDQNLGQLLSWIASSEPFSLSPLTIAQSDWRTANEQRLEQIRRAEAVFAAAPSWGTAAAGGSLRGSFLALKQWTGLGTVQDSVATLAQPDLQKPNPNRTRRGSRAPQLPPMSLAVHAERLTNVERAYIQGLVANEKLDWDLKVQHILLLAEFEWLDDGTKSLIGEIRDAYAGDSEAALAGLLWMVKNSAANPWIDRENL